ncbi:MULTISPECIES: hypothetical protein [Enterobacter cloacae complex]|uniref:hypothetical protein n=1 Tax=Enterobacter cloacae complex TaxID=354276 RepID=UPI001012F809|nr:MULTISPECIES: hypothetical protein [Enterobacter cloacae complex]MDQ6584452.1 hypothetical protein [Enterobacter hormaechei]RYA41436.1 hypothetical protein DD603_13000 [Enterobacter cloacae complex sp. 2DZ2F2B]RYA45718.1 hypothetical protein DD605_06320 [Enterobacter cloacae complex sp. 3DZ3S2B]
MNYQANKSVIKKLMILKDKIQETITENQEAYIAHSQGIYSLVIETSEGDHIKEAYYHHLGKLKSTSINKRFLERQLLRITKKL